MSSENELIKLYSSRILALATELSAPSRLQKPDATVKKRSPLCGSAVIVDITIENGRVADFAQDVKACALGQAAASVLGTRDALHKMLKTDGPAPEAPFDEMEVLRPAKDFKNRHASIMLSIEAVTEAMQKVGQKKGYA